ncbi:MAG: ROK family protein [Caldithrix sp.]|nr:ROK family protein [Caldithrix sp.]
MMFKSGSTRLVRSLNQNHILNLVRMNKGITAKEISGITGLQISTVLYTLKHLKQKGYMHSIGLGTSTTKGGKPPQLWRINADYGLAMGCEILSSEVRITTLQFDTEVLYKTTYPLRDVSTPRHFIEKIEDILQRFLKINMSRNDNLLGIGIGVSGRVDASQGKIIYSAANRLTDIPLRHILHSKFQMPVYIDNDANAGALGVKWLVPEFQERSDLLFLSLQQDFSGMGIGMIMDHQLYRGASGGAGEIKDVLLPSTWQYLFKQAIKKFGERCELCHVNQGGSQTVPCISEVLQYALKHDAGAQFLLREAAKRIADQIKDLINLLDPEAVVIGGDITEARDFIEPVFNKRLTEVNPSGQKRQVPIHFSPFHKYTGAVGAATLVLHQMYS